MAGKPVYYIEAGEEHWEVINVQATAELIIRAGMSNLLWNATLKMIALYLITS